ncbi:unnamed protein product [Danaus chrysippus]|uniref:(African queen) hypothetical protein n=1 Tax=Danaus chrysippus TaxID=151541 RepID=A0A8J2WAU5_9NEOP|nr:unnamed protein product [Danaus chrysippus]
MYSAQRLGVVSAELESIRQLFVTLDIYKRPMIAVENEDFIANVNRKEMRKIEFELLRRRERELQQEKNKLLIELSKLRSSYESLQELLGSCVQAEDQVGKSLHNKYEGAQALRDSLGAISVRLLAAAEYGKAALRHLDVALPAWKLASMGKSGIERTSSCCDACSCLTRARCDERCARRVLAACSAPRAARELRLALDYAFTDTMHDHRYKKTTEIFHQFKDALVQFINYIHQVLLNNIENLEDAEKNLTEYRNQLRSHRSKAILKMGLTELSYDSVTLKSLKRRNKILKET